VNGGQGGGYPASEGGQWPNEGSPAGGGTPYGQEPYGAPGAYGQQPYGQGGYGGTQPQGGPYRDPYGAETPSYGPGGEPPKKSRAGLIVGLAVVAVIVVIGAVVVVIGASSGDDKSADASPPSASPSAVDAEVPHTIRLPSTFGGYRHLTGSVADRLSQNIRKSMNANANGKYADVYAKAKIAIYAKKSDPTHSLIFIGLSSSDNPAIAKELKSRSSSEEADSAFVGMGIGDTKDFPPGPLGGVLRCGTGSMDGTSAAACTWADSSTAGVVIVPDTRNAAALAGTTLKLRNAAEH
jgi:hypothetical protein